MAWHSEQHTGSPQFSPMSTMSQRTPCLHKLPIYIINIPNSFSDREKFFKNYFLKKKYTYYIPEIHFIADSVLHPTPQDIQPQHRAINVTCI